MRSYPCNVNGQIWLRSGHRHWQSLLAETRFCTCRFACSEDDYGMAAMGLVNSYFEPVQFFLSALFLLGRLFLNGTRRRQR
jgi:hypothetical protein